MAPDDIRLAVEHVEVHVKNAQVLAAKLKHYGGLFVGAGAAEVTYSIITEWLHNLTSLLLNSFIHQQFVGDGAGPYLCSQYRSSAITAPGRTTPCRRGVPRAHTAA